MEAGAAYRAAGMGHPKVGKCKMQKKGADKCLQVCQKKCEKDETCRFFTLFLKDSSQWKKGGGMETYAAGVLRAPSGPKATLALFGVVKGWLGLVWVD